MKKKKSFPKGYIRDTSNDKIVYLKDNSDEKALLLQRNRKAKADGAKKAVAK